MEIIYRQSETLGEFASAFAKAQGKFGVAIKDSKNPHFKSNFASFAALIDACQAPLSENLISRIQRAISDTDGRPYLETVLIHGGSGQWMSSTVAIGADPKKPQEFGSALTYLKRYTLASMLGIPQADDDSDDDGEGAEGRGRDGGRNDPPPRQQPRPEPRQDPKPAPIKGVAEVDWAKVKSAGDFTIGSGNDKGKRVSEIADLAGYRRSLESALVDPSNQQHRDIIQGRIRAVYDLQHSRGEVTPLGGGREPGSDG